jgi:hypothetical protein
MKEVRNTHRKYWFLAAAVFLIAGLFAVSMVGADGGGACYGTYLVDTGQTEGLWTLAKDGTVQVTDSAEVIFGFSHEQGAWKHTLDREAKATFLDFTFDPNSPSPVGYARVDADFVYSNDCNSLSGTLDLWIYGPSEDPLDRSTGGFQAGDDILHRPPHQPLAAMPMRPGNK